MTTPSRHVPRAIASGLALLATLLASACDDGRDHDDSAPRLAVVLVSESGLEENLGSYDVETGEVTFAPAVQNEMRDRIEDAGFRAIVAHDGEDAEVDFDAGVAVTTADLAEGDVLELRALRVDVGTSTIGRLELRDAEDGFRGVESIWKDGNVGGMDDWEKHNT